MFKLRNPSKVLMIVITLAVILLIRLKFDPYLWKCGPIFRAMTLYAVIPRLRQMKGASKSDVIELFGKPDGILTADWMWGYQTPCWFFGDQLGAVYIYFDSATGKFDRWTWDESGS